MSWHKFFFTLVFIPSIFALSSCHPLKPKSHLSPAPLVSAEKRAEILKLLSKREDEIKTLRILCRVRVEQDQERQSFRYALVYQKPGKLRIEILPLDAAYSFSVFVADGEKATLLNLVDKQAFERESAEHLLRRVMDLPLNVDQAAALITGRVAGQDLEIISDKVKIQNAGAKEEQAILDYNSGQLFWQVNLLSGLLGQSESNSQFNGKPEILAEYQDIISSKGINFPKKISLELPKSSAKIELVVTSISVNDELKSGVFQVEIPEDFSRL